MPTSTVDLTALAGLFALVTTNLVQLVKPLIEGIPGIMAPKNAALHDSVLRLAQYLINLALLLAAFYTVPSAFVGLSWFDLLAIAFGQAIVSHVTYATTTAGKVDAPTATPLAGTVADAVTPPAATPAA